MPRNADLDHLPTQGRNVPYTYLLKHSPPLRGLCYMLEKVLELKFTLKLHQRLGLALPFAATQIMFASSFTWQPFRCLETATMYVIFLINSLQCQSLHFFPLFFTVLGFKILFTILVILFGLFQGLSVLLNMWEAEHRLKSQTWAWIWPLSYACIVNWGK